MVHVCKTRSVTLMDTEKLHGMHSSYSLISANLSDEKYIKFDKQRN